MPHSNIEFALKGAPNFRDIGGYKTASGRSVARKRVFRSERLASLTVSDLEIISKLGIRSVCDLRSTLERTSHPNRWPHGHAFDDLHCEILNDVRAANGATFGPLRLDPTAAGARSMMMAIYRAMPKAFALHFSSLLNRIVDGGVPLLIHCTAGKDRTGFAVAVLLSVLGVHRDTIYSDYLLTARYSHHEERIASVTSLVALQLGHVPDERIVDTLLGVDPAYLDAAFEMLESSYGSIDSYLCKGCGIEESKLLRMKDILLE